MPRLNKEQILAAIDRMPATVELDEVIYRLELLRKVGIAREQAERGEVIDDEDLEQWLTRDEQEETAPRVDDGSAAGSRGDKAVHRA